MRIAIVAARFNDHVTEPLLDGAPRRRCASTALDDVAGARGCRARSSSRSSRKRLARSGTVDAVICLGAVIRGDTPHFDYVAGECAAGHHARRRSTPACRSCSACSPSTTSTRRSPACGGAEGNKGEEAAATAVEMVSLLRQISPDRPKRRHLMLRLVLPKGSLERADPRSCSKTPTSRSCAAPTSTTARTHRRPARRRGAHPAAAGDPALRRRRPASTSASPGATGSRRRDADVVDASPSCTTRRRRRARSASCSRSRPTRPWQSVDGPARPACVVHTEYPELTRRFFEQARRRRRRRAVVRRHRGQGPRHRRRGRRDHRDRPRAARRRAARSSTPILVVVHRAHRQPGRVRRPREAQGDGAAADAAHRRARSARPGAA